MDIIQKKNEMDNNKDSLRLESSVDSGVSLSSDFSSIPSSSKPRKKNKKKKFFSHLAANNFEDLYSLKNDVLGQGSYGRVETCTHLFTGKEFAVKIINKDSWAYSRQKILKEIELYYLCNNHEAIIQMVDYFEESTAFYLVFEKAKGGHLLNQINKKKTFSEKEAALTIKRLASALEFLHSKGIAHRDLKPENVLCMTSNDLEEGDLDIKLCDFDLCSKVQNGLTTPRLASPVGSPEYLAPEVVNVFLNEDNILYDLLEDEDLTYDKQCDLWSLGVIAYTLLSGVLPFRGCCGRDCGWEDRNEECAQCQQDLFEAIQKGHFEWPRALKVSYLAQDLIGKLLRLDPDQRLEAADVLCHPWIVQQTSHEDFDLELDNRSFSRQVRRSWSFNSLKNSSEEESGCVNEGKKFRRQSSQVVVTSFCQRTSQDMLCRCEL